MPDPMFGDCGQGFTDEYGITVIYFDDLFRKSINSSVEYQVFLQEQGEGKVWVLLKQEDYFIVSGTKNLKFSWEVKIKQFDSAMTRLEKYKEFDDRIDIVNTTIVNTENMLEKSVDQYIKQQEDLLYETTQQLYGNKY